MIEVHTIHRGGRSLAIGRIDLNLIKVFDAVFEDRNLLLAGKRLNLSSSAVSHALTRLRQVVDDELFVRTVTGMMPTARAHAMAGDLRDSLDKITATLGVDALDPAMSSRRFVVAANDHLTAVLVARLTRMITLEAPQIDLVVRPSTRLDLAEQIDVGRIDLALGRVQQVPERLRSMALLTALSWSAAWRENPRCLIGRRFRKRWRRSARSRAFR